MKEYVIRGHILEWQMPEVLRDRINDSLTESATVSSMCSDNPEDYTLSREQLRVEAWDRDVRFDDRLASTTTSFGVGVFELRFIEEAFRREPGETESEPDVFFQVFRQRQLLFTTEAELLPENFFTTVEQIPTIGMVNQQTLFLPHGVDRIKQGYPVIDKCYRLWIIGAFVRNIPDVDEERDPVNESPVIDTVVDVLPTSDQVFGVGRQTAVPVTESVGGSLQQVVDAALGQVLGHTSRSGNGKSLRTALSQAFTLEASNGRENYVWNPRTYSTTQNELGGAITGAQASLYSRAKAALKETLPLLDGLYALDPAADQQNREAVRSIVRTELIELVNEFGVPQGPREQRVDSLFQILLGTDDPGQLPDEVGGQLKDLAIAFGLTRDRINTVDEERNFGNFLTIKDYIISLRQSWSNFVSVRSSGAGAFVGTQLVLLSQALSVMAESVRETYRIMDLVFLGPEERRSVFIDFTKARATEVSSPVAFPLPDGTGFLKANTSQLSPSMDLERLLSWALRFATEEGPTLARSGGKLGIANVIAETAERLMILLQAASYTPVRNSAFRRAGVVRALRDLAFQTYQVQRLAEELIPPSISGRPDDVGDRPLLPTNPSGRG
jgi:hypothetical protein